ncbi:MAG: hypothetical protein AAGC53_03635 [Actinomycetota bacterium]
MNVRIFTTALEAQVLPGQRARRPTSSHSSPEEVARCGASRARHRVTRYVTANRLDQFLTLTAAEAVSRSTLLKLVQATIRRLRRRLGGFPWLFVPEESPRLHAHLFVPHRIASPVEDNWPHGYVDRQRLASLDDLRAASLYVTKHFGAPAAGTRRYYVARGYEPASETVEINSLTALEEIAASLDAEPSAVTPSNPTTGFLLPTIRFSPTEERIESTSPHHRKTPN